MIFAPAGGRGQTVNACRSAGSGQGHHQQLRLSQPLHWEYLSRVTLTEVEAGRRSRGVKPAPGRMPSAAGSPIERCSLVPMWHATASGSVPPNSCVRKATPSRSIALRARRP
jgi:hypothetical protein